MGLKKRSIKYTYLMNRHITIVLNTKTISQNKIAGNFHFKNKDGFSLIVSPWGFLGGDEQKW